MPGEASLPWTALAPRHKKERRYLPAHPRGFLARLRLASAVQDLDITCVFGRAGQTVSRPIAATLSSQVGCDLDVQDASAGGRAQLTTCAKSVDGVAVDAQADWGLVGRRP